LFSIFLVVPTNGNAGLSIILTWHTVTARPQCEVIFAMIKRDNDPVGRPYARGRFINSSDAAGSRELRKATHLSNTLSECCPRVLRDTISFQRPCHVSQSARRRGFSGKPSGDSTDSNP
jgi:hypothetical protein